MSLQQVADGQVNPEVPINENAETLQVAAIYGKRHPVTSGLVWGYYGGLWGGATIADGTVALTDNATNYIVVDANAGTVSVATADTNWKDTGNYLRAYKVTTSGGVVTAVEDHRAGPGGVAGGSGSGQIATPVIVAAATGTYAPDCARHRNFQLTLTGNLTLDNPTNLSIGTLLTFCLDEDGTGGRTITLGSMFKWPAGVAPVWVTTAGAKNFFQGYYDGSVIRCLGGAGYA